MRARALGPPDPLLELSIGLAYLHRAMQRQADNRHILVLQGMTFVFQYYRAIQERARRYTANQGAAMRQEAEYNVARAFHQTGLLSHATAYYDRVIEISKEEDLKNDLVFEAAHNLSLIYFMSGNYEAASEITEKYLVL
jgi:general transcription factor 3C polypeptide 3 (transcription factor C subunit 4)